MSDELAGILRRNGFALYGDSVRPLSDDSKLFVVRRGAEKLVGLHRTPFDSAQSGGVRLGSQEMTEVTSGGTVSLHELTWDNYVALRDTASLAPSPCDRKASFGTGDRLGLVTAAHLNTDKGFPVFPVVAQQSPRELGKTNRTFKSVLLDAVMGVLESGYAGKFGADADHIKDEDRLREGVEAGYSMFTLDVSDWLQDASSVSADSLSPLSRSIVSENAGKKVAGTDYAVSEQELLKSALIYEKSIEQVRHFDGIIKSGLKDYDLEVSIDEGSRDTTPEDHLFVAEYLHGSGIDFSSLAPKFPGEFQKAVDYMGDVDALTKSLNVHAALARMLQGYWLSLHSGSDKFSIYPLFGEATQGNYHIKTSGTSWLMAVKLIASQNPDLFRQLYRLCLDNLDESKKAYHVYITREHFPNEATGDLLSFYDNPDIRQLFHISYGVLLDAKRTEIFDTLIENEDEHYSFVSEHIGRHLKLLFD